MRVLVVDDDQAVAQMITRYLTKEGIQVFTALDALQAIAILDVERVDAVVTDLMMPHLDGRALIRRIRADPRTHDVPVILITAYFQDDTVDVVLREGASLYLSKPIDLQMLATMLRFTGA